METKENLKILRIFISSTDKFKFRPLYEVIVYAAKRYKLAGATVFQGMMGYGGNSPVYIRSSWEIIERRPLIIEIIDEEPKLNEFIGILKTYFEKSKNECIVTMEDVKVVYYKIR